MNRQDYIEMLQGMQNRNSGMRGLTPDQREAIRDVQAAVNAIVNGLSDGFDVLLSDVRELDNARWAMYHAFSRTEPCDHQRDAMQSHGLGWDYGAGEWFVLPDNE